ncbi:protein-L-isoaspartate O-methyltransferase [Brachybacterium timonense]|uniref:protein-L-isoaspartate O-methyltransferase n=1 Tax=Brachybacterium timonense TaxID=2050896 RepID=UPI0014837EDB|nr:protein-L-isoaspartate O-methyltransferase [Brachybacterium timonense]
MNQLPERRFHPREDIDPRVREAMTAMPREHFLAPELRKLAYVDCPFDIGVGQTNSQPSVVERMLDLLQVQPGQRVLDVGSGSGWTSALLAHLVGADGSVLGVERQPELIDLSRTTLTELGLDRVEIRRAQDGVFGWPQEAPFSRILVSAAPDEVPEGLVEQLDDGGIMVIPVAGIVHRVERRGTEIIDTEHGEARFVPLIAEGVADDGQE